MSYLHVPYLSQWSSSALAYRADCGPACVGMVLAYYNRLGAFTVDQLARQTALYSGNTGLTPAQLVTLAKRHNLRTSVRAGVTEADIRAQLVQKRPVIPLISYGALSGRLDQNYKGGHYVVIVGCDGSHFVLNDPDYFTPHLTAGMSVYVPIAEMMQGMAAYNGECVVIEENMTIAEQIADLARQIEALAAQVENPPVIVPVDVITVYVTSVNGANVRSSPTAAITTNKVGGLKVNTAVIVEEAPVIGTDGGEWYHITSGVFDGNYIAKSVVGANPT